MRVKIGSAEDWDAFDPADVPLPLKRLEIEISDVNCEGDFTFSEERQLPPWISELRMKVRNSKLQGVGACHQDLSSFEITVVGSTLDRVSAYHVARGNGVEVNCRQSTIRIIDVAYNGARLVKLHETNLGELLLKAQPVDKLCVSGPSGGKGAPVLFGLSEYNGAEITHASLDGVEISSIDPARYFFEDLTLRNCRITDGLDLSGRINEFGKPFAESLRLVDTTIAGDLIAPPGRIQQLNVEGSRVAGRAELHTNKDVTVQRSTLQGPTSIRASGKVDLTDTTVAGSTTIALLGGEVDLTGITVEDALIISLEDASEPGSVTGLGGARLVGDLRLGPGIVLAAPDLGTVEGLEQLELSHPDQLPASNEEVAQGRSGGKRYSWLQRQLFKGRAYAGLEGEGSPEYSELNASTYGRLRSKARSQSKGGLESALLLAEYQERMAQRGLTKPVLYAYGLVGGFGIKFLFPLVWLGVLVVSMALCLSNFGGELRLQPFVDALRVALPGLAPETPAGLAPGEADDSSFNALMETLTSAFTPLLLGFTAFGLRWQVRR